MRSVRTPRTGNTVRYRPLRRRVRRHVERDPLRILWHPSAARHLLVQERCPRDEPRCPRTNRQWFRRSAVCPSVAAEPAGTRIAGRAAVQGADQVATAGGSACAKSIPVAIIVGTPRRIIEYAGQHLQTAHCIALWLADTSDAYVARRTAAAVQTDGGCGGSDRHGRSCVGPIVCTQRAGDKGGPVGP